MKIFAKIFQLFSWIGISIFSTLGIQNILIKVSDQTKGALSFILSFLIIAIIVCVFALIVLVLSELIKWIVDGEWDTEDVLYSIFAPIVFIEDKFSDKIGYFFRTREVKRIEKKYKKVAPPVQKIEGIEGRDFNIPKVLKRL